MFIIVRNVPKKSIILTPLYKIHLTTQIASITPKKEIRIAKKEPGRILMHDVRKAKKSEF